MSFLIFVVASRPDVKIEGALDVASGRLPVGSYLIFELFFMPTNTFNVVDYKKSIDNLLKELPSRTGNILSRRFGMEGKQNNLSIGGRGETLEDIGKDYQITRERVRQIENKGLQTIRKSRKFPKLKTAFSKIKCFIDENGGLKRDDILRASLSSEPEFEPCLFFILKVGGPFFYQPDSQLFYPLWKTSQDAPEIADKVSDFFVELMEKEKRLFKEDEIMEIGRKEVSKELKRNLKNDQIISYIEATKKIEENPFGEFGPAFWPEVRPKNSGSKAFLVLRNEKKPLHFKELAVLIGKELNRPVRANTLHNELIKNDQFVLVGRGTYALKEWGYKDGTVKDVIEDILREKEELSRQEIIEEVKKQRIVKETTIALNLRYFQKTDNGKYTL